MGLHDGHRKRLKEQFLNHSDGFHDHQLLELLLCYAIPQGDVNGLSHRLLDRFGSLAGVLDARPEALEQVPGVGEHTAVLLKLIPVLSGRYQADRAGMGTILDSTQAAGQYLRPYFSQGARYEMAYLVCLDGKYKVLGCHKLDEGTVNAAEITPRKMVEIVLAHNATAAILAHNHLSGLALPSNADLMSTQQLRTILRSVDVELLDHLIFTDDDMVSLKDSGFFSD
ncbi:JAB domain-containing protein [Intestinimonas timonensis]|uniref:JAB domain-containing protein n=1 Tax=Intestinimonas timonensis TaxID=1689270 RepID=UPI003A92CD08